ncbi:MAG: DUF4203 domain-containing protein [Planctomycetes bacterium]|nr:DUF4203 domain-containing protein [Planctomycetota bacterium]
MDIPFLTALLGELGQFTIITIAVACTVHGLVLLFFGYRLFRLLATLTGLAVGEILAVGLSIHYLPDYSLLHYLLGLVGAAVGAAIFYYVSVFALGAILGVGVAHLIGWAWLISRGYETNAAAQNGMIVSYVIAGLTAGVLALVFKRPFLIILTSLGGASAAVQGASLAAGGLAAVVNSFSIFGRILAALTFVILAAIGIVTQMKVTSSVKEDEDDEEDNDDEKPRKKHSTKSRKKN